MNKSESRILTTHVGSLPRSPALLDLLLRSEHGESVSPEILDAAIARDLTHVVTKQKEVGVDIASDGEIPRIGFSFYVKDRMTGFGGVANRGASADMKRFPGYADLKTVRGASAITKSATVYSAPECQCAVRYDTSLKAARNELDSFAKALDQVGARASFADTFVTAATPGIVSTTLLRAAKNPDYRDDCSYVFALAKELKQEYELIVQRGHILQLDAPDLAFERQLMFDGRPLSEFQERVEMHIEALNVAVADIPRDRIRMHVCWGNSDSPHSNDVALEDMLPLFYKARVGAISIAASMPRHAHEWKVFKKYPLPADMILIPGVIDVTTNVLEHPELVAERIERFVDVVGDRTRVIAGTDCGFSTFAGYVLVAEDVAWEKMRILSEGARIASRRLWSH